MKEQVSKKLNGSNEPKIEQKANANGENNKVIIVEGFDYDII